MEGGYVLLGVSNVRPGMLQRVVIVDCGIEMCNDDDDDNLDGRSDDSFSSDSLEEDGGRQRKNDPVPK